MDLEGGGLHRRVCLKHWKHRKMGIIELSERPERPERHERVEQCEQVERVERVKILYLHFADSYVTCRLRVVLGCRSHFPLFVRCLTATLTSCPALRISNSSWMQYWVLLMSSDGHTSFNTRKSHIAKPERHRFVTFYKRYQFEEYPQAQYIPLLNVSCKQIN